MMDLASSSSSVLSSAHVVEVSLDSPAVGSINAASVDALNRWETSS